MFNGDYALVYSGVVTVKREDGGKRSVSLNDSREECARAQFVRFIGDKL
jgi:hypothetical protein